MDMLTITYKDKLSATAKLPSDCLHQDVLPAPHTDPTPFSPPPAPQLQASLVAYIAALPQTTTSISIITLFTIFHLVADNSF